MRFEYKLVSFMDAGAEVEQELNRYAADQWEVVSAGSVPMPNRFIVLLRRPKK